MVPGPQSDQHRQIDLIRRLVHGMTGSGIRFWLSGGWAVDFHLGRLTRPHSDIDFVVDLDDKEALWDLLEREGAAHTGTDEAGGVETFVLDDLQVEVTYVLTGEKGRWFTPGYEAWPWPEGSLPDGNVTLAGISARAVSVAGLLDMKESWEENLGEKPRPHDVADIEALRSMLDGS